MYSKKPVTVRCLVFHFFKNSLIFQSVFISKNTNFIIAVNFNSSIIVAAKKNWASSKKIRRRVWQQVSFFALFCRPLCAFCFEIGLRSVYLVKKWVKLTLIVCLQHKRSARGVYWIVNRLGSWFLTRSFRSMWTPFLFFLSKIADCFFEASRFLTKASVSLQNWFKYSKRTWARVFHSSAQGPP